MTSVRHILSEAKRSVIPGKVEEESLGGVAESVLSRVREASERFPEVRGSIIGGSFAKGTWLPEEADIDIFVKISPEVEDGRFEEVGLSVGREAVRGYPYGKKYAQHPYTEAMVDGVRVNIVPCYDVKPGEWRSAADRSQYHVIFVRQNLDEGKKTEVRLLKRFMRVIGVYGAEIENEGFSGYAAEVLVHLHGGFEQVLRSFATLRLERDQAYAVYDPVDSKRDLARAISKESVAKMILASRTFMKEPNLEYLTGLRRRVHASLKEQVYAVVFRHEEMSEDTLWGELKRSGKRVRRYLVERGFRVARLLPASSNAQESAFVILPESDLLPSLIERVGPGAEFMEVERFIGKNHRRSLLTWVAEDGRIHVLQERGRTTLRETLDHMLAAEMDKVGASRELALGLRRSGRVLAGMKLVRESERRKWLREGVLEIVSDTVGTDSGR